MLTEIRDIVIIVGISITFVMLLVTSILVINLFLKIRRLTNYIENSLEEISELLKKFFSTSSLTNLFGA